MLTPAFSLYQDADFLFAEITAPFANISETEVEFFDKEFRFFSKPYFLRLSLPGKVTQNGNERVTWVAETNTFQVRMPKVNKDEHFPDLDMITKLLTVSGDMKAKVRPLIEVEASNDPVASDEEEIDWHVDQKPWTQNDDLSILGEKYGFANSYTGVFARFGDELSQLVDVQSPENKALSQRRIERLDIETKQFSDDHYLADFYENSEIKMLIGLNINWADSVSEFSNEQKFRMKNLPKKQYLIDKDMKYRLLLGMVDILYAYAYETRVTEGEMSVESGWTICKLSSTLSWLEIFDSLHQVIVSCIRRSLCYPILRNWDLSVKIVNDVCEIIGNGRNSVLKCFLRIHQIFNEYGEMRHILNDLYITDYCVWLQTVKKSTFTSLCEAIKKININKDDIDLDLTLLETAAEAALEEQDELASNEASTLLQKLAIKEQDQMRSDTSNESSDASSSFSTTDSDESSTGLDSDCTSSAGDSSESTEDSSSDEEEDINDDVCERNEKSR